MSIAHITDDDRNAINTAVAAAESKTSAEIVPVVADSSGRYDRAEDLCGLWLGLILMIITWILLPEPIREPGSWGGPSLLCYPFALTAAVVFGAGALGIGACGDDETSTSVTDAVNDASSAASDLSSTASDLSTTATDLTNEATDLTDAVQDATGGG